MNALKYPQGCSISLQEIQQIQVFYDDLTQVFISSPFLVY